MFVKWAMVWKPVKFEIKVLRNSSFRIYFRLLRFMVVWGLFLVLTVVLSTFDEAVLLSNHKRVQLLQKPSRNWMLSTQENCILTRQSHWRFCWHLAKNVILTKKKKQPTFALWLVPTFEIGTSEGLSKHIVASPIARSRAADLPQSQSEPRINIRVKPRSLLSPLRSPGVLAGHFLLHNNRPSSPHNDNVNILYVPYNNHSENTQHGGSKDNVC